ncbi:MAG: MBL fold metallo-hydrolase [Chloroflexota bacterium]|nr:MBL fold metallo-hydrolase [Chloroflexota bacterium]
MPAEIRTTQVGPWGMNTYVIVDPAAGRSAIVDPGADAETILALTADTTVDKILLTHAHPDHWGALAEVKEATKVPVYLHPAETAAYDVPFDVPLAGGQIIELGELQLQTVHTPGHTPGMICFKIDHRIIVGDTLFVGGPGKTWSPEEFVTTLRTLQEIVFVWPDETEFYPGHGSSGTIGQERPAFEAFVARGWPADLYGDVTWE